MSTPILDKSLAKGTCIHVTPKSHGDSLEKVGESLYLFHRSHSYALYSLLSLVDFMWHGTKKQ